MFFGKEDPEKVQKMKYRLKQHAQEIVDKLKWKKQALSYSIRILFEKNKYIKLNLLIKNKINLLK